MITANDFWQWFKKNNAKYFFLNQIASKKKKEKLLDEFLRQLHRYSDKLFFQIGGYPDETKELIITAEGNRDYFHKVTELVNQAPSVKDWNIIAFKQPNEPDFTVHYNGIDLNPTEMWFSPLEDPNTPELIGLKIFSNEFDEKKEDDYLFAANLVLDDLLGEKSYAEDIAYLEIAKTPDDYPTEDLIALSELPDYVRWQKNKRT